MAFGIIIGKTILAIVTLSIAIPIQFQNTYKPSYTGKRIGTKTIRVYST